MFVPLQFQNVHQPMIFLPHTCWFNKPGWGCEKWLRIPSFSSKELSVGIKRGLWGKTGSSRPPFFAPNMVEEESKSRFWSCHGSCIKSNAHDGKFKVKLLRSHYLSAPQCLLPWDLWIDGGWLSVWPRPLSLRAASLENWNPAAEEFCQGRGEVAVARLALTYFQNNAFQPRGKKKSLRTTILKKNVDRVNRRVGHITAAHWELHLLGDGSKAFTVASLKLKCPSLHSKLFALFQHEVRTGVRKGWQVKIGTTTAEEISPTKHDPDFSLHVLLGLKSHRNARIIVHVNTFCSPSVI